MHSKDSICLMSSLVTRACEPVITYGLLLVKRVWVAHRVYLGHTESLHMANTKYLVDCVVLKMFNITARQPCQQAGKFVSGTAAQACCYCVDR